MNEPAFNLAKELVETGIFEYYHGRPLPTLYVFLKETNFRYNARSLCWYRYITKYTNRSIAHIKSGPLSFEEVLEQVSPEIQTKLLFHLDLFR